MNTTTRTARVPLRGRRPLLASLGLLGLLVAPQASAQKSFTLTAAIPDDVFVVTGQRFNPEKQFLADEWAEVFEEFQASGIVEELTDLALSKLGAEQQVEAERIVSRFNELCSAVDWEALGSGEMAFGERIAGRPLDEHFPTFGIPDYVVLFRVADELAEKNFAGLRALLDAILQEVNGVSGMQLTLDAESRDGTEVLSFNLLQMVKQAPPMTISVGRRGDVLFLSMGESFRDRMLALLAGTSDEQSIAESSRFQAAFSGLPEAEDGFEYVDIQALNGSIGQIVESVMAVVDRSAASRVGDQISREHRLAEAIELSRQGYAAYEQGDNEQALLLTAKAHETDPKDSIVMYNMACLHALTGDKDQALYWLERSVEAGFHAPNKLGIDEDLKSLRSEPRYLAAVELAGEKARAGGGEGDALSVRRMAEKLIDRGLGVIGMFDHAATVHYTENRATYAESITALTEQARSNPFYAVIASGEPMQDFAKYLPQETKTFQVSASIDLDALYSYLLASITDLGPAGEQILGQWEQIQQQAGFDLQKDVFGWIDGASVNSSFVLEGREAWVSMLKVKDEQAAREKLDLGLDLGLKKLAELSAEIPQLALLSMRAKAVEREGLQGFHELALVMAPQPMICGVQDGWLICGSSEDAVLLTLATGRGEHQNARENAELMARALVPESPAGMVSFRDHSQDAQAMAGVLGSLSMMAGMAGMAIPDEDARDAVMKVFGIIAKLAPVVAAIDFYESSSAHSTFDGDRWHALSVTHYVPASE